MHLLSAEVTQRRRELDPVKTLIYGLRRYDSDRTVAAIEAAEGEVPPVGQVPPAGQHPGFLSHKAKVYLADVHEHAEFIMTRYVPSQTRATSDVNLMAVWRCSNMWLRTSSTIRSMSLRTKRTRSCDVLLLPPSLSPHSRLSLVTSYVSAYRS